MAHTHTLASSGSLFNLLYANAAPPAPEVGMGATVLMYTDRHAGTIVEICGKRLVWQADAATRTDKNGMSDAQSYSYERNPKGETRVFRLAKDGRWKQVGSPSTVLMVGARREYRDYSF